MTILSPANGQTLYSTSVRVQATAASPNGVRLLRVFLDGKQVHNSPSDRIDITVNLSPSSYELRVEAKDTANDVFSSRVLFTVANQLAEEVAVSISPWSASVEAGKTVQFTAAVTGTTNTGVAWSVAGGGGTVSSSGLYTAPSGAGTATVRATSVADATKSAQAGVTIVDPAPDPSLPAVSIGSPANEAVIAGSSVWIEGSAQSAAGIKVIQIYLNGNKYAEEVASSIARTATLPAGLHRLTIQAMDGEGNWGKQTMYFTVEAETGALPVDVVVTSPVNGSVFTDVSSIYVYAVASSLDGIQSVRVLLNGSQVRQQTSGIVDFQMAVTPGTHTLVVEATSALNVTSKATAGFTVKGSAVVGLSWDSSPSVIAGYYVYRGGQPGGPYTRISSAIQGLAFDDTNVASGSTYHYVVTAVDAQGRESVYSNEAKALIP